MPDRTLRQHRNTAGSISMAGFILRYLDGYLAESRSYVNITTLPRQHRNITRLHFDAW
jgi:hypothetical protein